MCFTAFFVEKSNEVALEGEDEEGYFPVASRYLQSEYTWVRAFLLSLLGSSLKSHTAPSNHRGSMPPISPFLFTITSRNLILSLRMVMSYPRYSVMPNLKGEKRPNTMSASLDTYLESPNPATEGLTLPNLKLSLPSDSKACCCMRIGE